MRMGGMQLCDSDAVLCGRRCSFCTHSSLHHTMQTGGKRYASELKFCSDPSLSPLGGFIEGKCPALLFVENDEYEFIYRSATTPPESIEEC